MDCCHDYWIDQYQRRSLSLLISDSDTKCPMLAVQMKKKKKIKDDDDEERVIYQATYFSDFQIYPCLLFYLSQSETGRKIDKSNSIQFHVHRS